MYEKLFKDDSSKTNFLRKKNITVWLALVIFF